MKFYWNYWLLPTVFIVLAMLVYFFDWGGFSAWIAPPMNREWGVLENVQLLILVWTLVAAIQGWRQQEEYNLAKWFFLIVAMGTLFVFLEEIDYGLHIYDDFMAVEQAAPVEGVRNLHNQGKLTHLMKLSAYIGLAVLIVLLPFVVNYTPATTAMGRFLRWLQPARALIIPLVIMVLINQLALYLDRNWALESVTALNNNISEFEEVFIYFIIGRYVKDLSVTPYRVELN